MEDFILDVKITVKVKPVSPKVGLTQRGPYERNMVTKFSRASTLFVGTNANIDTIMENAAKTMTRQWPLGVKPPEINSISDPTLAATTATLKANVTDGPVSLASPAAALVIAAAAGTITRPSGDFLDEGFLPGMTIDTTGFTTAANNSDWIIKTVTATVITVETITGLADETGGGNEVVTVSKTGVFVEYGLDKNANSIVTQAATSPISAEAAADITFALTGLTADTQYYYRIAMVAQGLTVRSQLKTFVTTA